MARQQAPKRHRKVKTGNGRKSSRTNTRPRANRANRTLLAAAQDSVSEELAPIPSALERADDLLKSMTIEEKAMQLSAVMPFALIGPDGPIQSQLEAQLQHGIGHVSGIGLFGHKTPLMLARTINAIQHYLVTRTRLGIPAIFHNEALNGVVSCGFTHFPTPIGLAATWDTASVQSMADCMRRQMRSVGLLQALAPVLDVARDARWGRVHETYGEDPYLVTAMGVAFTRGMQGDDLEAGVLATAKHFLGYGMTEGGQNMAATMLGPRELHDVYSRPFEAAIRLAGLGSVMASYSEYDGVPIHGSRALLTDLLRGRLGFRGTVVSDYSGVVWMHTRQRVAVTAEQAGALALTAGMDVELPSIVCYGKVLANAVRTGAIPESLLDESVRRVLHDKFALGLFDDPFVPEDPIGIRKVTHAGNELSRRLAAESVTLLKNADRLLPLDGDIDRIAVIGPHADSTLIGFPAYTFPAAVAQLRARALGVGETSMAGAESDQGSWLPPEVMEAMNAAMRLELHDVMAMDLEDYVRSSYPAVSLTEAIRRILPDTQVTAVAGTGVTPSEPTDIVAAVNAARNADVVILAVGGRSAWMGTDVTEGEGKDSADIALPEQQIDLIKAVTAIGRPTIAVVSMGRPYALGDIVDHVPAILTAYFGGPHQGKAIADAIFGMLNPGGKLPFTLPRHVGQVPIHHAQKTGSGYRRTPADIHQGYLDMQSTPLFPFGHGLSYTMFEYSPIELASDRVDATEEARVSLTVVNAGDRRGVEVVQLYAADTATGVTRPAQQLIGFARLDLERGAWATVTFVVPASLLAYTGLSGELIIEPGPVELIAGSSSTDIRSTATITITGRTHTVHGKDRAFLSTTTIERAPSS